MTYVTDVQDSDAVDFRSLKIRKRLNAGLLDFAEPMQFQNRIARLAILSKSNDAHGNI